MSTNRSSGGRQSQSVYVRRRLTVLGVLVVIIVVIILIIARPGSGKPTAANTHTPTSGSTQSATKAPACKDSDIQVIAVTDATSYAAGVDPMLSLTITNTGAADCSFDVGTDAQKYVITSGTDQIWSSADCQTGAEPLTKTLKPGVTLKTSPFAWKRTRSNASDCAATNAPQVIAGGASYHLTASVGGVASSTANSPQFILR